MVQLNIKTGCWLWLGQINNWGYAVFSERGENIPGYQWSFRYFKGPIPDGQQPDHLCRIRPCVNPDHLEAVPMKVNILRGTSVSAINARKTTCSRGHEFDGFDQRYGFRYCKTCKREVKLLRKERGDELASENLRD
jgi:hypothetical protein